jgi:hypothetical protein
MRPGNVTGQHNIRDVPKILPVLAKPAAQGLSSIIVKHGSSAGAPGNEAPPSHPEFPSS